MAPPKMLLDWLAPQLASPRGVVGRLVGWLMNRGNQNMNAFAIDSLALAPAHRVLDVGFGGGLTLRPLAERVHAGLVVGVEPSETMLAAARARLGDLVAAGRLRLEAGTIEALPLDDASIDAACTTNTIYFWKDPQVAVRELRRVLVPGGRVAITFLPADRMEANGFPRTVFRYWSPDEVVALLRAGGFSEVRQARPENAGGRWLSVLAQA